MKNLFKIQRDKTFVPATPTGEVFVVGNGTWLTGGVNRLSSIEKALARCVSYRGDVIYVLPGHTETYSAAAGLVINKHCVSIIGVGGMATRPALTLGTAVTCDIDVTANDVTIENITFKSALADIAVCIDVAAKGLTLRNCSFIEAADNQNFLVCVQTEGSNACDDICIEDCLFAQDDAANTECIELVGAHARAIIRNNYFRGAWSVSAISAITAASTDIQIVDNLIVNVVEGDDLAGAIDLVAATTGIIANNGIYHADDTDCLTSIDGANCGRVGNYAANEYGEEAGLAAAAST